MIIPLVRRGLSSIGGLIRRNGYPHSFQRIGSAASGRETQRGPVGDPILARAWDIRESRTGSGGPVVEGDKLLRIDAMPFRGVDVEGASWEVTRPDGRVFAVTLIDRGSSIVGRLDTGGSNAR